MNLFLEAKITFCDPKRGGDPQFEKPSSRPHLFTHEILSKNAMFHPSCKAWYFLTGSQVHMTAKVRVNVCRMSKIAVTGM